MRTRNPSTNGAPRRTPAASNGKRPLYVLGISAFYHDSAAALVRDGEIVAAAQEERFTRLKNDRRFPESAINYCLEQAGIHARDLSAVIYYDNAAQTFERVLTSAVRGGKAGKKLWMRALPTWLQHKLHVPRIIRDTLSYDGLILQGSHHRSHAAAAFYPSPFAEAAVLTVDGVGEWATASIGEGEGSELRLLREMRFPNSLGLLYSAFTQFTGFKANSGEYKMMGLAPYGEPKYLSAIREHLVDVKPDGSLELNPEYFDLISGGAMANERFARLFGGPGRRPEARITRREIDLARSIQALTEEVLLRMAKHAHELSNRRFLCLAGGVALNCVANGRLLVEGPFEDIWIQPAAGDAGSALGAALDAYHGYFARERAAPVAGRSLQGGSFLGPTFSDEEIQSYLETHGYPYRKLEPQERGELIAEALADGKVVGHFSGRAEFGPRALGARSILADARSPDMQATLNLKIKYRESFRPFAPAVLAERVSDYFELDRQSPYMLLVAPVKAERRLPFSPVPGEDLLPVVRTARSDVPAITHVDYSARIQTISAEDHPQFYEVLRAFESRTGCAVIVNTSFNVRGEPIVNTPYDAYRCFMRTELDVLVMGNCLLLKPEQPAWPEGKGGTSDDVEEAAATAESRLSSKLEELYEAHVVPLQERETKDGWDSWHRASAWERIVTPVDPSEFVIPNALDQGNFEPVAMAAAIARFWRPGEDSERLRGLLDKLLELARTHPAKGPLEERVSAMAYVMF